MIDSLVNFFRQLYQEFLNFFRFLYGFFSELLTSVKYFVDTVYDWFVTATANFIAMSEPPSFFLEFGNAMQAIPPEIGYFLHMAQLPFGLGVVATAYLLRFGLRRIPFIG